MKADEERIIGGHFEDVLFRLNPVDIFVLADQFLLDHLTTHNHSKLLEIAVSVMGYSLIRSHRSLVRGLRTARFARSLTLSFARSLTHSLLSS